MGTVGLQCHREGTQPGVSVWSAITKFNSSRVKKGAAGWTAQRARQITNCPHPKTLTLVGAQRFPLASARAQVEVKHYASIINLSQLLKQDVQISDPHEINNNNNNNKNMSLIESLYKKLWQLLNIANTQPSRHSNLSLPEQYKSKLMPK